MTSVEIKKEVEEILPQQTFSNSNEKEEIVKRLLTLIDKVKFDFKYNKETSRDFLGL